MSSPTADQLAWAEQALAAYPLVAPSVSFLGHSENVTFRVEVRGATFLLRLYQPRAAFFAREPLRSAEIASEMVWLDALHREARLLAPRPVANHDGAWVTLLEVEPAGALLPCTLLRWVEGEPFHPRAPQAQEWTHALGHLMAALHGFARGWEPPEGFQRPRYDAARFEHVVERLARGQEMGVLGPEGFHAIAAAVGEALPLLATIPPREWGLIHADLHPENLVVCGPKVCPLDFSLCGFGPFLFDLATSAGSLPTRLRPALLAGYAEHAPLPGDALRRIEACLLLSRLSYYAAVLDDPTERDWLRSRIPILVDSLCLPFTRGQGFLFDVR